MNFEVEPCICFTAECLTEIKEQDSTQKQIYILIGKITSYSVRWYVGVSPEAPCMRDPPHVLRSHGFQEK